MDLPNHQEKNIELKIRDILKQDGPLSPRELHQKVSRELGDGPVVEDAIVSVIESLVEKGALRYNSKKKLELREPKKSA